MKQCLICKEYLEDSALKCGKCGATQPKSSVTLPPKQARYSFTAVPRKWFPSAPIHALLFGDSEIHDLLLKPVSDAAKDAGTLAFGASKMDIVDLHAVRRVWPKIKDLPMSQLTSRYELARSIPYRSLAWVGIDNESGGARIILALNSGRFRVYMTSSNWGSPPVEEVATGLNNILYPKVTWANGYQIPDNMYED